LDTYYICRDVVDVAEQTRANLDLIIIPKPGRPGQQAIQPD
jgi:hypothetical protein